MASSNAPETPVGVRPQVQAMLDWIGSNSLAQPAEMVERLRVDGTVAVNALSSLLLESYVETDEDVGPRVSTFERNENHRAFNIFHAEEQNLLGVAKRPESQQQENCDDEQGRQNFVFINY